MRDSGSTGRFHAGSLNFRCIWYTHAFDTWKCGSLSFLFFYPSTGGFYKKVERRQLWVQPFEWLIYKKKRKKKTNLISFHFDFIFHDFFFFMFFPTIPFIIFALLLLPLSRNSHAGHSKLFSSPPNSYDYGHARQWVHFPNYGTCLAFCGSSMLGGTRRTTAVAPRTCLPRGACTLYPTLAQHLIPATWEGLPDGLQ